MSQDLLSEFLPPLETPLSHTPQPTRSSVDTSESAPPGAALAHDVEDDDDFGDFEDAEIAPEPLATKQDDSTIEQHKVTPQATKPPATQWTAPVATGRHPFAGSMDFLFNTENDDEYDAGHDELDDLATNPEAAMAYSKRVIAQQQVDEQRRVTIAPKTADVSGAVQPHAHNARREITSVRDPSVLFDVELDGESVDDDFGDFETYSEPNVDPIRRHEPQIQPTHDYGDLLGVENVQSATDSTKLDQRSTSDDKAAVSPAAHFDDPWDDFEDAQPSMAAVTTRSEAPSGTPAQQRFQMRPKAMTAVRPQETITDLPPTNVPPPVVLLSLFPSLLASADDALFKPLSKLDSKQRQVLLAHPATQQFVRGYLTYAHALGHIIAGRKLRWKRDQYLAQGMRIGPAGGKSGMKLTGLDKTEVVKEDREVLDTVRIWKAQVGKLRSVVTAGSLNIGVGTAKMPALPEISEQLPVKALKAVEGGVTAPHACALCGLKREERVLKVDVEVDDSFGEWWVPGMSMHVVCKAFWGEFTRKQRLR